MTDLSHQIFFFFYNPFDVSVQLLLLFTDQHFIRSVLNTTREACLPGHSRATHSDAKIKFYFPRPYRYVRADLCFIYDIHCTI